MMSIWEFFGRDITLFGELHSPMLSWLGSGGLIALFLWHAGRLMSAISSGQACYMRVWPTLESLAASRKSLQAEWLVVPHLSEVKKAANQTGAQPERVDLDDLHTLDRAMRGEPRLEQAWLHFRKTFVVERTAWFIEPKVFATRTAAEFFPRDLLNSRLNLSFYHQFP
ncbi:MAG: hypothetical protein H8K06_12165, partial [Nitrospira sp.]|nr:hypothetical protein [Nitrospira sp.]